MKSFKDVETTRRDYHRDAALNTVHRASLLIPEFPGSQAEISFLNHFLLKRGYQQVACRVTALDATGARIEARLITVDQPRVYTLPLSALFGEKAAAYQVEFFCAENLFIPFPAVMVNHRGNHHLNTVHAYNRILNDVFEDDAINHTQVREASIDVATRPGDDTFLLLSAGLQRCKGALTLELSTTITTQSTSVAVDVPRMGHQLFSVAKLFPEHTGGVLKVTQPKQFMFYGRLLCGVRRVDGAFSANHSYYDCSAHPEYWEDNAPSFRLYPYIPGLDNQIRMYPIMSAGELEVSVELRDSHGQVTACVQTPGVTSPSGEYLDVTIGQIAKTNGVDPQAISAFAIYARPRDGGTPTRINHQLLHSHGELAASVNSSLVNRNVFQPTGKPGFTWGQIPVGAELDTRLGIVGNDPTGTNTDILVTLYDEGGKVNQRTMRLPGGGGITIDTDTWVPESGTTRNVWYTIEGTRSDISAFAVTRHRLSNHCSGEHSF